MNSSLLVPIKVQALVIDTLVVEKSGVVKVGEKWAANDGRWSPLKYDYQQLTTTLDTPGPRPFYGATRSYKGSDAHQLVLDSRSTAMPKMSDRGIYLHWVLPAGLRHAYTPGMLDFPALPDHWLIVRFSHRNSAVATKAWFVDGGAVVSETGSGNLLFPGDNKYAAKLVGKVIPFEQFATANAPGERTTITALGNATTGSPTFTAYIAENRNVFSWQDTLEDLRDANVIAGDTTLTYLVLGWYRDPKHEPLTSPAAKVIEQLKEGVLTGWLIDPPGWFVDAQSGAGDLLKRRSVFHGMVAHINYWSEKSYKGPLLGYPGSPGIHSGLGKARPAFTVGVGNSAEDALVSLVSSSYSGEQSGSILAKEQPNLWKALEAVIYRQTEALVRSWNVAPLDMSVHQNSFATRDAGRIWLIRSKLEKQESVFPKNADETAKQTKIRATEAQLAKLKELNQIQAEADAISREMSALQQDLYARWWKLCAKSRNFSERLSAADEKDPRKLADDIGALRTRLDGLRNQLNSLPEQLKQTLEPMQLELTYDAAPRFWLPADPVIVLKNSGRQTKHQFPSPHPCRVPEEIATTAEVVTDVMGKNQRQTFNTPAGVAEIAAAALKHLPACPDVISALLNEGSIVEQAIRHLAAKTLPDGNEFSEVGKWRGWTEQLQHDLAWDGKSKPAASDEISFGKPGAMKIRGHRVADMWAEQPWSPLFLDWQITWFPTAQTPTAENPFGPVWIAGDADFAPLNRASIPQKPFLTVRGRSLLSPIDERIFKEPIKTLRELINDSGDQKNTNPLFPARANEVLRRYEIVWDNTLKELCAAGLMGQALSGFHQSLLRREVILPRISPDATRPWIANATDTLKDLEARVSKALEPADPAGLTSERLAPPAPPPPPTAPVFQMLRAGALRIDELWLVDDFGQSVDLLGRTPAGSKPTGQVFHPRIRWHNDERVVAMPPRVLQPARLNFRFTAEPDGATNKCDPALDPICGWLFFNPLDQALVLCDRCGDLMGHLPIIKDERGRRVIWDPSAGGVPLEKFTNTSLREFAKSLIQNTPVANPRLLELLNLIDTALDRIRPAAARNNNILVDRPLALVNATIGLELFGKAWMDPQAPVVERKGTGDATLEALRVPVNLGDLHNVEDGLIGYFKGDKYEHIVVTCADQIKPTEYIGDPKKDSVHVGFGAPEKLSLLMDPWGSVQAACGIVPAKTISLAHAELDETVMQMETSFRVGPVLLQADRIALPTPAGEKGVWNFSGPLTNQTAKPVIAVDPRHFNDQPIVATEGRLLLLNNE